MRKTPSLPILLVLLFVMAWASRAVPALAAGESSAESNPSGIIELIDPQEQSTVVGKQPVIRFRFSSLENVEGYLAILDGTDITALVRQDQYDFIYQPIEPLPSGDHLLMVIVYYADGTQVEEQKSFHSRHSGQFEEAYSNNDVGAVYRSAVYRRGRFEDESNYQVTGNLSSSSKIKEGGFEATADGNLWYLKQNQPVPPPQESGVNLADFLLTASYTQDDMKAYTEVGDIPIDLTPYLIQGLSRRGGAAGVTYGDYAFRASNTSSRDLFGFNGGLGLSDSSDDSISAFSGTADLFSGLMNVKAAYLTGGVEKDSYNIWTVDSGARKGDAAGVLLQSNLFDQRLLLEAEGGYSDYDFNTSDEFSSQTGHAYRFAASGYYEQFTYGASYQYISPDYEVIGASGTVNDREEIRANGGFNFDNDAIQITLARYHDNVENDRLYPRITYTDGAIDYTLGRFGNITATLGYLRNLEKSSHEPDELVKVDAATDTFTTTLGYFKESYSVGLSGTYAERDDKTDADYDSRILSLGLTPAYYSEWISTAAGLNWTRVTDETTDVNTDTFTASLNLNGTIIKDKLTYDLAGTYTTNETSDDSIDMVSLDTIAKLTYTITDDFYGFANPSVGLEGRYFYSRDRLTDDTENDAMITLVFSTSYHFGF